MLAYVFWHRPRAEITPSVYERAQVAFHDSLAGDPPAGFGGSACFRVAKLPWLGDAPGYEDWYFVEDYTALGALNEAAVGNAHSATHDEVARGFGTGAGGLYGLIEGGLKLGEEGLKLGEDGPKLEEGSLELEAGSPKLEATSVSWIALPPGSPRPPLAELLADGIDPRQASMWRRQLVLGPAPEYCLLGADAATGIDPHSLPEGWTAASLARERLTA